MPSRRSSIITRPLSNYLPTWSSLRPSSSLWPSWLVVPSQIHALTTVTPNTLRAWQRAPSPLIIASRIVERHSTPATRTADEHSSLRDNQCASGKGYVGEPSWNQEVWQNSILIHVLPFYLFVLVRFNNKQGDSWHVHKLPWAGIRRSWEE